MRAYERFLKYVTYKTDSSETSGTHPSTGEQFKLAEVLIDELRALGAVDIRLSDKCYLYARIPATAGCEGAPRLGFIAHMDTSPDFSGDGVSPRLVANYDGTDIPLGDSGRVLSPKMFPHLRTLVGRTLITTDGRTLLGADDKAGIAEIMTLAELLHAEAHGDVLIGFTPDEEIGEGADFFDVAGFGADFAYTVDGGVEGSMEYENFNAAGARFEISGINVHPGSAKDTMVNAALVATEINSMLPSGETPRDTEGYEGFYHLTDISGDVEAARLDYIVRDHDAESFEKRLAVLRGIRDKIAEKYPSGQIKLTITEQYRNMKEKIEPHMHLIENARLATEKAGLVPSVEPIRGGTDGARLSYMGLPCPNLGTGGFAGHGPFEHASVEGMDKVVEILLWLVRIYKDFRI